MPFARLLRLVAVMLSVATLAACDNVPTGPGTGSGSLLRATIDGTTYTFTLDESQTRYDAPAQYSYVFGLNGSGTSTKSLIVTFVADLDNGTFPRTLPRDDVNIILIDRASGVDLTYDCMTHDTDRSMTLTSSSSGIVDGTFSGTLANRTDAARRVALSGGEFSVALR